MHFIPVENADSVNYSVPLEGDAEQMHTNLPPSMIAVRLALAFFKPLGIAPETWEMEAFDELLKEHSEETITEVISWARQEPFWGPLLNLAFLRTKFRKMLIQCRSEGLYKTKTSKPLNLPGRKATSMLSHFVAACI
jgi:hypothetical protein